MIKINMDSLESTVNGKPLQGRITFNKKVAKKERVPTFRKVCFTSFKCLSFDDYHKMYNDHMENIKYLVVGLETCPTTKKQHIQGFIQLSSGYKVSTVKGWLPDRTTHIEGCKGTVQQNIKYCTKENNFKEYGTSQYQGKRNDITDALNKYQDLSSFIKAEPAMYVKYRSGVEGYYRDKGIDYNPLDDKPIVIWLYGDTGTGKSRTVKDYLKLKIQDGYRVWRRPLGTTAWFDGYSGQDIVFLDELRGSTYKFDDLLQMLDYDCPQVPVKGSFVNFNPKVILITSNSHPKHTYEHINDENKRQLERRCDYIYHVKRYNSGLLTRLSSMA